MMGPRPKGLDTPPSTGYFSDSLQSLQAFMEENSPSTIGFILLTHSNPEQFLRLTGRLNQLFNFPPIVCHHDFSQCDLPLDRATPNLSFVQPHVRTKWADFSLVEAMLRGTEHLLERSDCPDWLVVLSGADYPLKPAWRVLQDLTSGSYDAHMAYSLIDPKTSQRDWDRQCCDRYLRKNIQIPWLTKKLEFAWRNLSFSYHISSYFLPFSNKFPCYAGSMWFTLNRRAAQYAVEAAQTHPRVHHHFKVSHIADEAYFQTMLVNAQSLKVHNNNYRYLDWSLGGWHPKTLELADVPKLIASPDHFARKFSIDKPEVLDAIDAAVDQL
jgi:hypothetical protein